MFLVVLLYYSSSPHNTGASPPDSDGSGRKHAHQNGLTDLLRQPRKEFCEAELQHRQLQDELEGWIALFTSRGIPLDAIKEYLAKSCPPVERPVARAREPNRQSGRGLVGQGGQSMAIRGGPETNLAGDAQVGNGTSSVATGNAAAAPSGSEDQEMTSLGADDAAAQSATPVVKQEGVESAESVAPAPIAGPSAAAKAPVAPKVTAAPPGSKPKPMSRSAEAPAANRRPNGKKLVCRDFFLKEEGCQRAACPNLHLADVGFLNSNAFKNARSIPERHRKLFDDLEAQAKRARDSQGLERGTVIGSATNKSWADRVADGDDEVMANGH